MPTRFVDAYGLRYFIEEHGDLPHHEKTAFDRMGDALRKMCDTLPEGERAECRREVGEIISDMRDARDAIMAEGGSHWNRFAGASCDECEVHARDSFENVRTYFEYESQFNRGVFDIPWVGGPKQHCWGAIAFKGPSGEIQSTLVGIVDFWEVGQDDFWFAPEDHPWEASDTTMVEDAYDAVFDAMQEHEIDISPPRW